MGFTVQALGVRLGKAVAEATDCAHAIVVITVCWHGQVASCTVAIVVAAVVVADSVRSASARGWA